MISLEQVLLLQKKVETAVETIKALNAEISQLRDENAALQTQCAELSKALSDKTELVSLLEADQNHIEESIINALNQLDTVENAILDSGTVSSGSDTSSCSEKSSECGEQTEVEVVTGIEVSGSQDQTAVQEGEASIDSSVNSNFDIF